MLDHFEYMIAWSVYVLSAIGIMAVWWRITRFIGWRPIRQWIRVVVAMPLVAPVKLEVPTQEQVPVLFAWLFDSVLLKQEVSPEAKTALILSLVLAVVLWLLDMAFWWGWRAFRARQSGARKQTTLSSSLASGAAVSE